MSNLNRSSDPQRVPNHRVSQDVLQLIEFVAFQTAKEIIAQVVTETDSRQEKSAAQNN